ncbi:MAG: hypothetical protein H6822_22520 [Planctomycetaceae bacterium]|nr:hypothetical protein [Planctomycetales bacterium]MCB9924970.1 hypothetical protein [Planctomycetaceae bacterium]
MNDDVSREHSDELSEWLDGAGLPPKMDSAVGPSIDDGQRIADELVVHGLLRDAALHDRALEERRIQDALAAIDHDESPANPRSRTRSRVAVVCSVAAMAASVLIAVTLLRPTTATAAVALERIIESVSQSIDRAYRIRVVEEYSEHKRPQDLPEERWLVQSEEELDGSMLYVGGPSRYVFIRKLKDGRTRISGCDGNESWAFREDGPIHVSDDLTRFRGGLPGEQQNLGFTDLYSQLTGLREGYQVALSSEKRGDRLHHLTADRNSREVRGPKHVEIDFDASSGTIHRMFLDGLPRGGGGPKSVEVVLVARDDVDATFYSHTSHHGSGRRVRHEETQP